MALLLLTTVLHYYLNSLELYTKQKGKRGKKEEKKRKVACTFAFITSAPGVFGPWRGGRGERMLILFLLTLLFLISYRFSPSPLPFPNPFFFPSSRPPTLHRGLLDRPGRRRVHVRSPSMQAYGNAESAASP